MLLKTRVDIVHANQDKKTRVEIDIGTKGIIRRKDREEDTMFSAHENGKCDDAQQSDRIKRPGLRFGGIN